MQSAREFEAILRRLAMEQQGLVTRAGLLHAGVSAHVVERRVRSGRLKPLHRGVYQAGPVAGPRAREMAAVLACGRECRVSHTSAGEMWDLLPNRPTAPHVDVTVHRSRRVRIDGIRVHRVNELDPDEATKLEGIPVTTPARTLLDLGECVGVQELEHALARAERRGLVARDDVRAMATLHQPQRGARALRLLLRALHDDQPAALTRSKAEELLLDLVRRARLPAPEVNARLLRYEVDFLWRGARLVAEVDGAAYHDTVRAFVEDRRRDAELIAAGYRVVRFTWQDITQWREATVVRLAQALVR